jgi:hypothetical protein
MWASTAEAPTTTKKENLKMSKMPENLEQLIDQVEGSSYWRARKAEEYPGDHRNVTSSESLARLAERLRELPPDDPNVAAYQAAMDDLLAAEDIDSALVDLSEDQSRYIGRYGFDYPEDGDPAEFLQAMTELVNNAAERERAAADEGADPEEPQIIDEIIKVCELYGDAEIDVEQVIATVQRRLGVERALVASLIPDAVDRLDHEIAAKKAERRALQTLLAK